VSLLGFGCIVLGLLLALSPKVCLSWRSKKQEPSFDQRSKTNHFFLDKKTKQKNQG